MAMRFLGNKLKGCLPSWLRVPPPGGGQKVPSGGGVGWGTQRVPGDGESGPAGRWVIVHCPGGLPSNRDRRRTSTGRRPVTPYLSRRTRHPRAAERNPTRRRERRERDREAMDANVALYSAGVVHSARDGFTVAMG